MITGIKILNGILILVALFMGIKQGWAMISGKPEMLEMFGKWDINKTGIMLLGIFTIAGALMMLFYKTFVFGNFMMATSILFIIALHLSHKDLKGVLVELPFLLLSLVIIYLQYPLSGNKAIL